MGELKKNEAKVSLKEVAKNANGEFVTVVDVKAAKSKMTKLKNSYEGLVITKDNYKKEGAKAESALRQMRYDLQNMKTSNQDVLKQSRKDNDELFDGFIAIIKPFEEKFKLAITGFKDEARLEKENKEKEIKEREERLDKKIKSFEHDAEIWLVKGKDGEDLISYDALLASFKEGFSEFDERMYEARELHSIFIGRRKELIKSIEKFKLEKEKEIESEALSKEIFEHRKVVLVNVKRFEFEKDYFINGSLRYSKSMVVELNELAWYKFLNEIDELVDAAIVKEKKDLDAAKKESYQIWNDLILVLRSFGGDDKKWKLKKDEVPTVEKIGLLKAESKRLHTKKKAERLEQVKKEVEPLRIAFDSGIDNLKLKIGDLKLDESKSILNNFIEKLSELSVEIFGSDEL